VEILLECIQKNEARDANQDAILRVLENKIGQIANALSTRVNAILHVDTQQNPKRESSQEQCKVIELRSGKNIL